MAQVISWKVATGKYAYIEPLGGPYIQSRITDKTTLNSMAANVNSWSESEYEAHFLAMQAEVNKVYGNLNGSYTDYYDISQITDGTIVLLAGDDGVSYADGDGTAGTVAINESDWKKLADEIKRQMDDMHTQVLAEIESLKTNVETEVNDDLRDALEQLRATESALDNLRDEMMAAAASAQTALNALRDLGERELTQEERENIVSDLKPFKDWIDKYSGFVTDFKTEYDDTLGSIAQSEDVSRGLLSYVTTCINAISGTVGTAVATIDASRGAIEAMTTFYNESAASMTELARVMDASKGIIEDVADYIDGSQTSRLYSRINAQASEIAQGVSHESDSDVTNLERRINGVQGIVEDYGSRLNEVSGALVTFKDQWDLSAGTHTEALTIARQALSAATDMREVWNESSGMVRTVSNLYNDSFWYIPPKEHEDDPDIEPIEVVFKEERVDSETGKKYNVYVEKDDPSKEHTDYVYPNYIVTGFSTMVQNAGEISMTVSSGSILSALRLQVDSGTSKIYMTADRILLDSDVIANSLTANTANIGGVHIGNGMISAQTGSNKWALRGDGVLEATGAEITGNIHATSLTLGQAATNTISEMIDEKVVESSGMTEDAVKSLINDAAQESGWTAIDMGDYVRVDTPIGGVFEVSKDGLLVANNAIISGSVFATNGYFSGELKAANFDMGTINGSSIFGSDIYGSSLHVGGRLTDILNGNLDDTNILELDTQSNKFILRLSDAVQDNIVVRLNLNEAIDGKSVLKCQINSGSGVGYICFDGETAPISNDYFTNESGYNRTIAEISLQSGNSTILGKTIVVTDEDAGIDGLSFEDSQLGKILWASPYDSNFSVDRNGNMIAKNGYFEGNISAVTGHFGAFSIKNRNYIGEPCIMAEYSGYSEDFLFKDSMSLSPHLISIQSTSDSDENSAHTESILYISVADTDGISELYGGGIYLAFDEDRGNLAGRHPMFHKRAFYTNGSIECAKITTAFGNPVSTILSDARVIYTTSSATLFQKTGYWRINGETTNVPYTSPGSLFSKEDSPFWSYNGYSLGIKSNPLSGPSDTFTVDDGDTWTFNGSDLNIIAYGTPTYNSERNAWVIGWTNTHVGHPSSGIIVPNAIYKDVEPPEYKVTSGVTSGFLFEGYKDWGTFGEVKIQANASAQSSYVIVRLNKATSGLRLVTKSDWITATTSSSSAEPTISITVSSFSTGPERRGFVELFVKGILIGRITIRQYGSPFV